MMATFDANPFEDQAHIQPESSQPSKPIHSEIVRCFQIPGSLRIPPSKYFHLQPFTRFNRAFVPRCGADTVVLFECRYRGRSGSGRTSHHRNTTGCRVSGGHLRRPETTEDDSCFQGLHRFENNSCSQQSLDHRKQALTVFFPFPWIDHCMAVKNNFIRWRESEKIDSVPICLLQLKLQPQPLPLQPPRNWERGPAKAAAESRLMWCSPSTRAAPSGDRTSKHSWSSSRSVSNVSCMA